VNEINEIKLMVTDKEGIQYLHDFLMSELPEISAEVILEFEESDDYGGNFEIYVDTSEDDEEDLQIIAKITLRGKDETYSIPHYIHEFAHLYRFVAGGEYFEDSNEEYHSKGFYGVLKEIIEIIKEKLPDFEYPTEIEYPGSEELLGELELEEEIELEEETEEKEEVEEKEE